MTQIPAQHQVVAAAIFDHGFEAGCRHEMITSGLYASAVGKSKNQESQKKVHQQGLVASPQLVARPIPRLP
jgi:hypothetical protein